MSKKDDILALVADYKEAPPPFIPGESRVPYAGRVYDKEELQAGVSAVLDFTLTGGDKTREFERTFASILGLHHAVLTNSGSSANLLAITALMSPLLGARQLHKGDEVITVAAGFPTTLNPIIQNGLVPIFIDIDLKTLNIRENLIEEEITPKTKAIFVAHTLGIPVNMDNLKRIAKKHGLFLLEDNCDALGTICNGKPTGTFGDISTFSFYPAHHITMGEGGCVCTEENLLARIIKSLRDWGRDCVCPPGVYNVCKSEFTGQYGSLPVGYDHRYVYSHIGYNLKATDIQAAIGLAQLKKLPDFITARKRNYTILASFFEKHKHYFELCGPTTKDMYPSWFACPVRVLPTAPFTRTELTKYLAEHKIETRNLFGGNLLRQPAYEHIEKRVSCHGLKYTDEVMNSVFFLGVYPGLTDEMLLYVQFVIEAFLQGVK
jgi:CDP-6-deoxy-D-xylo-4-hexulose-3-dehydrase